MNDIELKLKNCDPAFADTAVELLEYLHRREKSNALSQLEIEARDAALRMLTRTFDNEAPHEQDTEN